MKIFTAPPQRIVGNIALASLVAGGPLGILLTVIAGLVLQSEDESMIAWAKELATGLLLGPFFILIAGLVLVAPALSVLRYFGYGGPFFVYLISIVFSLYALNDSLRFGGVVLLFSMAASYVFCRYAYPDTHRADR